MPPSLHPTNLCRKARISPKKLPVEAIVEIAYSYNNPHTSLKLEVVPPSVGEVSLILSVLLELHILRHLWYELWLWRAEAGSAF